jgi:flavodoxin
MKRAFGTMIAGLLMAGCAFAAGKPDTATTTVAKDTAVKAGLLKTVPDKKVLVVFFSLTGNTERVGKDIAGHFGADVEKIIDKKNRKGFFGFIGGGRDAAFKKLTEIEPIKTDPSRYDLIVIGTPIWAGTMTPAIRTYITQNKDKFKEVAFFTTAGGTPPEKTISAMENLCGKTRIAAVGFNRKELKDIGKYKLKISVFLDSFKSK